jgi:hypothetical protein
LPAFVQVLARVLPVLDLLTVLPAKILAHKRFNSRSFSEEGFRFSRKGQRERRLINFYP